MRVPVKDPQAEIERLKSQVKSLQQSLEKARAAYAELAKQQRDALTASVMGGLAARWSFDGEDCTSPSRLAQKGIQLVDAVMKERELWIKKASQSQHQDDK